MYSLWKAGKGSRSRGYTHRIQFNEARKGHYHWIFCIKQWQFRFVICLCCMFFCLHCFSCCFSSAFLHWKFCLSFWRTSAVYISWYLSFSLWIGLLLAFDVISCFLGYILGTWPGAFVSVLLFSSVSPHFRQQTLLDFIVPVKLHDIMLDHWLYWPESV